MLSKLKSSPWIPGDSGGVSKGQDFAPLAAAFKGKVRHVVLIGQDAGDVERALAGVVSSERAATSSMS